MCFRIFAMLNSTTAMNSCCSWRYMIAVTGDQVDSRHPDFEKAESLMRHLVKTAPCYYVTGNCEACLGERYLE